MIMEDARNTGKPFYRKLSGAHHNLFLGAFFKFTIVGTDNFLKRGRIVFLKQCRKNGTGEEHSINGLCCVPMHKAIAMAGKKVIWVQQSVLAK